MDESVVSVAVPLPFQTPFSYRLPRGVERPERGVRVLVPFGSRRVIGVVTGEKPAPQERELKEVASVLDEAPLVEPALLDLAEFVAHHYLAPPGECYRLVLPPFGVRASRSVVRLREGEGDRPRRSAGSSPPGPPGGGDAPLLEQLQAGPLRVSALAKRLGRDPAARLARLQREGLLSVEQAIDAPGFRELQVVSLVEHPPGLGRGGEADGRRDGGAESASRVGRPSKRTLGRAQAELVERLRQAGGRARVADLVREKPSLRGAIARLAEQGVLRVSAERDQRAPATLPDREAVAVVPTADQERALAELLPAVARGGFEAFLLHGVTGSGKSELYFRAAEAALADGRGAILLVPEIGLTPMLVRAARARFGASVSVLHSELSAGERHDEWWRIREGEARVVVGARSAVFAPVGRLGLLVVDEEHDSAYKQDESPRYQARDVAVMRARLEACAVVLGSATPSLESYANARSGKYRELRLPTRVAAQGLPRVEIVDRRAVLRAGGEPILSPALREALAERLARREQSLLLLNRRGYATSLLCRECGQEAMCPNCSVTLTLHSTGRLARCHYCGHEARTPEACPSCRGAYLRLSGFGTEKVAEAVAGALPAARVERLDRDRASRRGALAAMLASFERGEIDVLVGTQMIAKGHDFPRVTLVGVVDADVGLGIPDFRSAERTFQLLTQVAGRAGRGDAKGEVILQTHMPDHYALVHSCAQDYAGFYEREHEFRRTMGYPPVTALVNLIVRSADPEEARKAAAELGAALRARARQYRVLGPASAPLAKLRREHRFQILLKGARKAMREAVRSALVERHGETRWPNVSVDVDPSTIL